MTRLCLAFCLLAAAACERKTNATPAPTPPAPLAAAPSDGRRAKQSLEVIVDGKPAGAWSPEQVAALPRISSMNKNGEARDSWSLRDAAAKLIAPGARVTALISDDGERLDVTPADWSDTHKTLVLRVSNRGGYKAHWSAADGSSGDAVIKNVTKVELAK
jgi:hypothetical protein